MVIDPEAAYYELNDAHWLTAVEMFRLAQDNNPHGIPPQRGK